MFRSLTAICVAVAAIGLLSGCAAKYTDFGDPMRSAATEEVAVSEVLATPQDFDGKFVRVKGTVEEVCEGKGCWLTMTDGETDQALRVKFVCELIEDRLIPMEAVGHEVMVEGTLTMQEITEEMRKHYAEDSGMSAEEVAKIVGPKKELRFDAPAARIYAKFEQATHTEGAAESETAKSEG